MMAEDRKWIISRERDEALKQKRNPVVKRVTGKSIGGVRLYEDFKKQIKMHSTNK